jgi:hypothetical protein
LRLERDSPFELLELPPPDEPRLVGTRSDDERLGEALPRDIPFPPDEELALGISIRGAEKLDREPLPPKDRGTSILGTLSGLLGPPNERSPLDGWLLREGKLKLGRGCGLELPADELLPAERSPPDGIENFGTDTLEVEGENLGPVSPFGAEAVLDCDGGDSVILGAFGDSERSTLDELRGHDEPLDRPRNPLPADGNVGLDSGLAEVVGVRTTAELAKGGLTIGGLATAVACRAASESFGRLSFFTSEPGFFGSPRSGRSLAVARSRLLARSGKGLAPAGPGDLSSSDLPKSRFPRAGSFRSL